MQIPMFTINGLLYTGPRAYLAMDLPSITLMATSGGESQAVIPSLTLYAEAHQDPVAASDISLPKLTVIATGYVDSIATADCWLPVMLLSAEASQSELSNLDKSLPLLILDASAIMGDALNLASNLPLLKLDASAYWLAAGTLDSILPELKLSAFARVVYSALSFNIKNQALSAYPVFDFNHMATFNGKAIGISRAGIYELSGDKDDNASISWKLRSGKLDLKKNHLRQVWVTGKQDGTVTLAIEDAEGNRYEYQEVYLHENENELRIKVGKGIKTRYFILELSGIGSAIIDQLRIFGSGAERKR
jgi:hypothetical protein